MRYKALLIIAPCLVSLSSPSLAASGQAIASQGNKNGAVACVSCHGNQGQGNPAAGYPYLAGQSSAYLVKQLNDFADGKRSDPVMQPFAKALSADERKAVADYFSQLKSPSLQFKSDSKTATDGFRLATAGKWSVGLPSCFQCHGDKGQGVGEHFPAISAQPAEYLKKQLTQWKNKQRSNDPVGLMQAVVKHLDIKEIESVSRYLSGGAQ